jgi:hypothetical protein
MAYPGWLVCPGEKRRLLWSQHGGAGIGPYTDVIINSLEALSPEKQLYVLREISWRYDICLAPMSASLKQATDRVLGGFRPFPKLEGFDDAAFSFSDVQHAHLDWPRVRESWVCLALSRMRAAREDFEKQVFDRWHEILKPVVRDNQDWVCRLRYEACLETLSRLDRDSLAKQLKEWPEADNPPVSLTRKAALLAELGLLDEAERVASAALSQIRFQQCSGEDNIRLMSEEAWAMVLLEMIVAGGWGQRKGAWQRRTDLHREHGGRLRHLAPYFCDPWPDIERLRSAVTVPALRAGEETKRGFDPWYYSKTYHLFGTSGIDDAVLSAQGLIRLHEDGGFPMRVGNVSADAEAAKKAARLAFIERPASAVSLALRSGGSNSLEFLDRVAMAILPPPEVHMIFQIVYEGVTQAVKAVKKSGGDRTDPSAEFPRSVMSGGIQVLSRLAFRLPQDQLRSLLDLAVMLHESPNVQSDFALHSDLASLFTRVLYAMQDQEVIECLPTLLRLTIPGSEGSHVTLPDHWPEPVSYMNIPGAAKSVTNSTSLLSKSVLRTLINVLSGENLEARTRALWRILVLRSLDLLGEEESKECTRALWSQVDERTRLPRIGQRLPLSVILQLPETEKQEHHLLREFLLETAIPGTDLNRSQERVVNCFPTPLIDAAAGFLDSFNACSKALWLHCVSSGGAEYIDWTKEEAEQLVERSITFWENEKYDLPATKRMGKFFDDPHYRTRQLFARFASVLFLHMVPRLVKPPPVLRQRLAQVHEEMLNEDVPVLCTLPALLIMETASERDVINRIKSGLQSAEETRVLDAVDSVYFWSGLAANSGLGLPSVPEDLWKEMIGFAEARRQPGLEFVLSRLAYIVRLAPKTMSDIDKERLCAALTDILRETSLPTTLREYFQEEAVLNRPISASKKIEYQEVGVKLASALYSDYLTRGTAIPKSLEAWKKLSESSPLPEVRRAWQP